MTDENEDLKPENNTEAPTGAEGAQQEQQDEDDDEDEGSGSEDLRIAHEQIEQGGDAARQHRQRRKERQRLARERTQAELAALRAENEQIKQYIARISQQVGQTQVASLDQRLGFAQQHVQVAEQQIADATNRGDGEALTRALKYREDARATVERLRMEKARASGPPPQQQAQPQRQEVPPAAVYAREWYDANPWFDWNSNDPQVEATKRAERALMQEGWNPNERGFWKELSKRVVETAKPSGKRGGPPVAGAGAGKTSATEYNLSAERVQAIKDAGAWDDPEARARLIKAYKEFDKQNAAR